MPKSKEKQMLRAQKRARIAEEKSKLMQAEEREEEEEP